MMSVAVSERVKDLILAVFLAIAGLGGFAFINPSGVAVTFGPGGLSWRTLPFLYSGLLLGMVAIFSVSTIYDLILISRNKEPRALLGEPVPTPTAPITHIRRILTLACMIGFALALEPFGFAIATFVLLFLMLRILGRKKYLNNLATAGIGAFLLWVLFVGILKLPLAGNFWDPITPFLNQLYSLTGAR